MKSKVSAIITTYKRPNNLKRAIESVINQSYGNIEIIVVDDNDEGTKWRIQTSEIMKNYKDIKYIKHKNNCGGSAARNSGIFESTGEYIAFLDDDDEWLKTKTEKQIKRINKSPDNIGAVYCGYFAIYGDNKEKRLANKKGELLKEILLGEFSPGATSTLLFKKKVLVELNGFDEDFQRYQDIEILIRLFRNYGIEAIVEPLINKYGYNFPNANKLEKNKKKYLKKYKNDIEKMDFFVKRNIYSKEYISLSKQFIKEIKIFKGLKYLFLSFINNPLKFLNEIKIVLLKIKERSE